MQKTRTQRLENKNKNKNKRPYHDFGSHLVARKPRAKLYCLYENLMSCNFRKMAVLKKVETVN